MNPQDLKIQELERKVELLLLHRHSGVDSHKVNYDFLDNIPKNVLATTANTGFLAIPSCAGAPTGTPSSGVYLIYDSTNLKLYIWSGSAWKSVQLA